MRDRDTSADARRAQLDALRKMGPERRVALAIELSKRACATTLAGIRVRRPELSEAEARRILFRSVLGAELYAAAFTPQAPC